MCRLKARQVLVAGKPELDLELELHSSSTEGYGVWVARAVAEMSFVGWCGCPTETEPCQWPKNEAANISGQKKPHSPLLLLHRD